MTINNLKPALELWDNGFNVIPVKSKPIPPTPENPSEDKGLFKQPQLVGRNTRTPEPLERTYINGMKKVLT